MIFSKVLDAVIDLKESPFTTEFTSKLTKSLDLIQISTISDIICYGLGPFSSRSSSKYQLGLLLILRSQFKCETHVYDPIFSTIESQVLQKINFRIIDLNEEGKRSIQEKPTLVFMPHCSTELMNNFLYANWNLSLGNCVIVSNSFSEVVENCLLGDKTCRVSYLQRILPHTTEIKVINNFSRIEVFSSLSIHVFCKKQLESVLPAFWEERKEPSYSQVTDLILSNDSAKCS